MGKEKCIGANRNIGGLKNAVGYRGFSQHWDKGKEKEKLLVTVESSLGSVQKIENIATVEEVPKGKLSRKRLWRHYKRYLCCYAMLFVVVCAVGFPILFLVIFPAVAQRLVDSADLPIRSSMIMDPTNGSVIYSLIASLKVPKPFTVKLMPITLSLFRPETEPNIIPYVNVSLPEMKLKGNASVAITNQTATILDKSQFIDFLANAVYSEEFTLAARGETDAYLGKLKAHIHFNKAIKLKGLNMLNRFVINSARVLLPPEEDGTNLEGSFTIPNASIVTFELGNVTLNLKVGDLILGNATMENVLLKPGNNSISARGIIDLKTTIKNIGPIVTAEADALKAGNIEVSASGNQTIFNGQHIDYFEDVLNNLTLTAQMPIASILLDSLGGLLGGGGIYWEGLSKSEETEYNRNGH
ncbi:hypothetical protein AOQ84DRAFT_371763 [Glonium stellatum]|uniref:Uncharacterized protein n=1 Tax=Glonium stellatum TaxID=574774 RepID=A0A8E2JY15_9PEZI|nr:hypothetical protein AOQ84DRAFT_371763 [Glonium stellatum]